MQLWYAGLGWKYQMQVWEVTETPHLLLETSAMASENTVASVVRSESRPLSKAKDQEWITVTKLDPGVWDMKIKFFEVISSLCPTCFLRCSMRTFLKMYGLKIMFALSAVELASRPESSHTQVWVSLFQRNLCCHPSGYHFGQNFHCLCEERLWENKIADSIQFHIKW